MSDSQKQDENETSPIVNKTKQVANDSAIAMELPFTFAGAILLAGGAGFLLDRWLHTKPIFTLVLGAIGFIAGVREVIRRLPGK
jgi:F0F1-type ATP synthase assembly protein I